METGWECNQISGGVSTCFKKECGNEVLTSDEACDDGNTDDDDGCS